MEISLRYRVQYMHIFEYNTRCSNGAMNADYNGASEGSQGQDSGRREAPHHRICRHCTSRVSRVVTEYLLYLCICVEQ